MTLISDPSSSAQAGAAPSATGLRCAFLPGLAADARLFGPQLAAIPGAVTLPWIAPVGRETLEDYARRLAESISNLPERYALAGFSFGGQVALEMAQWLRPAPAGIVLICGVRGPEQFTRAFKWQQAVGGLLPDAVHRRLYAPMARAFARRCRLGPEHAATLLEMAVSNDPAFLRWSAWACNAWRCRPNLTVAGRTIPVRHIHGELDDVIPDPRRRADRTIPGAGHLITWTHADEVNRFIADALEYWEIDRPADHRG